MAAVRRCDYTGCANGPAGTPAVSDGANPEGWITAAARGLYGDAVGVTGDFDTELCAARALFGATFDVTEKPADPKP